MRRESREGGEILNLPPLWCVFADFLRKQKVRPPAGIPGGRQYRVGGAGRRGRRPLRRYGVGVRADVGIGPYGVTLRVRPLRTGESRVRRDGEPVPNGRNGGGLPLSLRAVEDAAGCCAIYPFLLHFPLRFLKCFCIIESKITEIKCLKIIFLKLSKKRNLFGPKCILSSEGAGSAANGAPAQNIWIMKRRYKT